MEINSLKVKHNFNAFQLHKPHYSIIPVLKCNAYGNGVYQLSKIVDTIENIDMIAVDDFEEYQIIHATTSKKILVLKEILPENYSFFDHIRTEFVIWNKENIDTIAKLWNAINLHIFINTGMNREGVQLYELSDLLKRLKQYSNLYIVWVMSHLAYAEDKTNSLNEIQYTNFKKALQEVRNYGYNPEYIHLEASTWMMNNIDTEWICNAWRLWLWLYWYSPLRFINSEHPILTQLLPVFDLYSTIIDIQDITLWDIVWYSATWKAEWPRRVASFPLWSGEGLSNLLSEQGFKVEIWWKFCELVGRISTNYACVDITSLKWVNVWEKVHVLSSNLADYNNIYKVAKLSNSLPLYHKLTRIIT